MMGGLQPGFSDGELAKAKKQFKREKLLSEMEVLVSWQALIALIEPAMVHIHSKVKHPFRVF